jgi:hypothetical protein
MPEVVTRWIGPLTLGLLTINGFITAWVEALFLPLYVGTIPLPVSIAVAAVVNYALMSAAATIQPRGIAPFLPVIAWAIAMVIMLGGGPGGDAILWPSWRTVGFCVAGLASALLFSVFRPIPDRQTA